MKLLFVVNDISFYGGLEKIVLKLSEYLIQNGFKVTILSLNKNNDKYYYEFDKNIKLDELKIPYIINSNNFFIKKIEEKRLKMRIKESVQEYLKKNKFDIMIGTFYQINDIMTELSGIKKIAWEHTHYYGYIDPEIHYLGLKGKFKKKYHELIYFKIRKKKYLKLDKVIVLTKRDLKTWQKDLSNVEYIHNALTTSNENKSINYDIENKRIVSVGRLEEQKGFIYLIDVFEEVLIQRPDWCLNIVGEGNNYNLLKEKIKTKKLDNNIKIINFKNNIGEEYTKASMYISTSIFEGFGLVITEAMSYGLPIIAFDCYASPRELIKNNVNGLLCSNRNIKEMAKKIIYLIDNKEIRKKMSMNATKESEKYKIDIIGERWKEIVEQL